MITDIAVLSLYTTILSMGTHQLFYYGDNLILRLRQRELCAVIPYEFHPFIDPGNARMNISEKFFNQVQTQCSFNHPNFVSNAFLRRSFKWCGTEEDEAVESCCSERFSCPVKLKRNQRKGKAVNKFPFAINGCECEEKFAQCLKNINNDESKKVLKYHFKTFMGGCLIYDFQQIYNGDSGKPKTCIKNKKKPKIWRVRKLKHLRVL